MFQLIKSVAHSVSQSVARGVRLDPELHRLLDRHPRLVKFIRHRLTADEEFGLHLTIGALVAAFFVYLFFGVTIDLIGPKPILQSDLNIINLLQVLRQPAFNRVMLFITDLAEWPVVFAGVACVGAVLALDRRRYVLPLLIVSVVGSEAFAWLVGTLMQRPRPELVNVLVRASGFSFPSSHTLVAVAFYGLLTYFIYRKTRRRSFRWLTVALGTLLVLAIGFSRIYLGAHWPSDVFASYAAGAAWLTALITVLEIRRRFSHRLPAKSYLGRKRLATFAAGAATVWALFFFWYYLAHPLRVTAYGEPFSDQFVPPAEITAQIVSELPHFSESLTGAQREPLNIVVVASREELDQAFRSVGWMLTDRLNPRSLWRMFVASVANRAYPSGPGIPSFWNDRPNDFAFEQSTIRQTIRQRHHIHFWETPYVTTNGRRVWVGTAHYDKGIKLRTSIFVPTHAIDPAVDKERQKVADDLMASGLVESEADFKLVEPTMGKNEAGDTFFTDGKAVEVFLKK